MIRNLKLKLINLIRLRSFLALVALIASQPQSLRAADPDIKWQTITTEHFEIIFDSKHYSLAKDFARHGETAWRTLAPVLRSWPDKTRVVIDDSGDQANGMATGFPYPQIHLYPATPSPGETIADTGPWGLELVMHEYTHILNFQPAHGVLHFLRTLFGEIIRPNGLLPRWYLEGLAVETETRFSPSGGRLRSPDFTAIPRAMVQSNTLRGEDISRIGTTELPDWPGGVRPYLLGGLIWQKLAKENLSLIGDLNDAYAKRLPFLIDTPIRERTGQDWQGYLDSVYTEVEKSSAAQIEEICENGCNEGTKLGETGFFSRSPALSPAVPGASAALAYIVREHNHDSVIQIISRGDQGRYEMTSVKRAAEPTNSTRLFWLPDASGLVYDGIDSVGRYEERSDLWLLERASNKNTRLSLGLRAREPAVSPKGTTIAFVQLTPGQTQIAIGTLTRPATGPAKIENVKTLFAPNSENRVSWPTFISEDTLVFTERDTEGHEVLKVLEIPQTGDTVSTTAPRAIASEGSVTFPRFLAATKQLLFSSNRSGVTNVYIADLSSLNAHDFSLRKIRPLTNSATRAWNGDLDSSGTLYYVRLDGDGAHIRHLTETDRAANQTVVDGRLVHVAPLFERAEPKYEVPESSISDTELQARDFNIWPYLVPRYWMPYAGFVPGGAFLSASTSAGDPMGRHSLVASVSTDTRIGKPNFFAAYSNYTTPIRFTLSADRFWQRFSSSGLDRNATTVDLSGVFFIPGLSNNWRGDVGLSHQRDEIPSNAGVDVRIKAGPRVGVLWQDLSQRGFEIAPEKGGSFRLAHSQFMAALGNQVYDKTDLAAASHYSRVSHPKLLGWLPERHAISTSIGANWLPGLDRLLLAPSSVSLPVETIALGPATTSFVMRGYPTGSFLGRKIVRGSIEYRLPLSKSYHGFGTWPAFIRRWHGAVFGDLLTAEGAFYDFEQARYRSSEMGQMFGAVGAEARLDTTLFYHMPVQFIFGVHFGIDKRVNPNGAYPVFSIAL